MGTQSRRAEKELTRGASYLRELGLDTGVYDALQRLFVAASQAGHGDADWTCIAGHVVPS